MFRIISNDYNLSDRVGTLPIWMIFVEDVEIVGDTKIWRFLNTVLPNSYTLCLLSNHLLCVSNAVYVVLQSDNVYSF